MEKNMDDLQKRTAPIEISPEEFRELGHRLVDRIAEYLAAMPEGKVTTGESPRKIRESLGWGGLPERGSDPGAILNEAASLLFDHSLFIGHPRFLGFITASAAPIGVLGDLLAAGVNPNLGGFILSPMATEIEVQTVRWIAELIGYPSDCGGLLVSGGNMANFVGFLAARKAKADWDVRTVGMGGSGGRRLGGYVWG